ncbi:MAG: type IV pilin protein [Betaproteobacteria bacterium]
MRHARGFSLIELVVTVMVIAILAALAYPSYRDYLRRGLRSQGQQFLMDIAQRQEQFFLDQRAYANALGVGGLGMTMPTEIANAYQAPVFTLTARPPPTFRIDLAPVASGPLSADGTLIINSLQQRWREITGGGDGAFGAGDCRWEDSRCTPS